MNNKKYILLLSAFCITPLNASPKYYAVLADLEDTVDTTEHNQYQDPIAKRMQIYSKDSIYRKLYDGVQNGVEQLKDSGQLTQENVLQKIDEQLQSGNASNETLEYNDRHYRNIFREITRIRFGTGKIERCAVDDKGDQFAILQKTCSGQMALGVWKESVGKWQRSDHIKTFNEPIEYMAWRDNGALLLILATATCKEGCRYTSYAFGGTPMHEIPISLKDALEKIDGKDWGCSEVCSDDDVSFRPANYYRWVRVQQSSKSQEGALIIIEELPSLKQIAQYICTQAQEANI